MGPSHSLLSLVSHAYYGNGTECNHLLFFNGAVKPIANLCRPQQLRVYEEALSQLMSPGGLITLLINSARMILHMWGETMLRARTCTCVYVYECERFGVVKSVYVVNGIHLCSMTVCTVCVLMYTHARP